MPQLSTLSSDELIQLKHHNQKLQQELEREMVDAAGPSRFQRIQQLHHRVTRYLHAIYFEFERRAGRPQTLLSGRL
jgi:hypothetical protein